MKRKREKSEPEVSSKNSKRLIEELYNEEKEIPLDSLPKVNFTKSSSDREPFGFFTEKDNEELEMLKKFIEENYNIPLRTYSQRDSLDLLLSTLVKSHKVSKGTHEGILKNNSPKNKI